MFRTVCGDLVRTLCGPNTTAIVGLGQYVMPAGSLNEASQVAVGTFVVKTPPVHFWQHPIIELLTPMCVEFDKSKGDPTTEVVVLDDIQKEIDMTEKNSLNLSALREVGVNMGVQGAYKMQADLGEIRRIDMKKECIKD
ncbi:uncharacterized protein LOC142345116 [Convolutriloba macropyga]|uniref:uncharacterized protein LOC142345116 n=1 Tax=Convolutriloba macropyga TaxID=536237 RepID=UPI003F528CFB